MLAHWDEVEAHRAEAGRLGGAWRDLGRAAGSVTIGVSRVEVDPGKWTTTVHRQTDEEEILYVLGGAGLCLQDDVAYEVAPGDCLVFLARGPGHGLKAEPAGLDLLAFSTPAARAPSETAVTKPEPELPALSGRPPNAVNLVDVEAEFDGAWKRLGRAAGSVRSGLNWGRLAPGELDENEHAHAVEEELFVVLEGGGTIFLGGEPHAVRAGSVIARPAATRVAHHWQAGPEGLTALFYGTREPNDIIWYPRERKLWFRGVGVGIDVPEDG